MSVSVGDKVQIKAGAVDVTNGTKAKAGKMYGSGGPYWATVDAITKKWSTGGKYGLPSKITKVRCVNKGVTVWQVQDSDCIVKASESKKSTATTKTTSTSSKTTSSSSSTTSTTTTTTSSSTKQTAITGSTSAYAPLKSAETWTEGSGTATKINSSIITNAATTYASTYKQSLSAFADSGTLSPGKKETYTYLVGSSDAELVWSKKQGKYVRATYSNKGLTTEQKKSIGSNSVMMDQKIKVLKKTTSWQDENKRKEMRNMDKTLIQNNYGFPIYLGNTNLDSDGNKLSKWPVMYDYKILVGDPRYSGPIVNLESKLTKARAALGIPVHGNNQIAKAMKYYMYNRFKTPDLNTAHNKSVTYVFFTRPDMYLLDKKSSSYTACSQVKNHTEAAMLWRKQPELFKLLCDRTHCGDSNNFNLLLSNQVQTFDIQDETLTTIRAGKSWNEYEIVYGEGYTGRTAGEFTCDFKETSDYSIIQLMKLWITYIDLVGRGAWSPCYTLGNNKMKNISASHVYSRTLDYAASVYVFKCGPDGEDVLYWSKYYGVFPVNTGANALSWDLTNPIGDDPKLSIRFAYSFKRDMSPISLIEFNRAANITKNSAIYEPAFNVNLGHAARPYVGAPFIEIDLGNPQLASDDVSRTMKKTSIRLKFLKDTKSSRSDSVLFKAPGSPSKTQASEGTSGVKITGTATSYY